MMIDEDEVYAYDYRRVGSALDENSEIPLNGRLLGSVQLDWRNPEQWDELKAWWGLAWPTMVLFFAQQSYTLIDMAFLGHFHDGQSSSEYLAASSQAGILFDITVAIFMRGFLQVLTVLCSQAYGAGKFKLVGQWLQLCVVVCLVSGIPIMIMWWFADDLISVLFGLDETLRPLIQTFSRWSILRLYPQLLCASLRQFCLAQKIIQPLVFIGVLGIVLNMVLNQVFLHGLFGWSGFGFKGSPIATAMTNLIIFIITSVYVFYWRTDTHKCWPKWSKDSINGPRVREFMKQALPLTLATVLEDFQIQTINAFAIKISRDYEGDGKWIIGTHNGLLSFFLSLNAFQWGVMKATSVRAGHYIGSQNAMYAKLVGQLAFIVSTIAAFISAGVLLLARHQVGHVISDDPKIIDEVAKLIIPLSGGMVALSFFYLSMAMLDAMGRPLIVAVGFFFGAWVVAVPLSYILGVAPVDMGLQGLWIGLMVGYSVTTAILCYAVVTTNWAKVLDAALHRNNLGDQEQLEQQFISPSPISMRRPSSQSIISADTYPFPSPVLS